MNIWKISYAFGTIILMVLWLINTFMAREVYCDHGPSEYDSYCPKCGLDSE
jgi:hypothetical protein